MKRKFLENLLTSYIEDDAARKETIDKIMDEHGEAIETQKKKIGVLENEIKVKEGIVDDLNKKVKENADIDIESIKKEEFEKGKAEGSKEVETFKKSVALEKALAGTKAKDVKLLEKLLDNEKLKYEEKDGNFTVAGLDEQVKGIKETHEYLFEEEKKNEEPGINLGGGHKNSTPKSEANTLADALHKKYD